MINNRKNELKKLVLENSKICTHLDIYRMIDSGNLDYLIDVLGEDSVACNKEIFGKSKLNANEQFIYLFDNFISYFENQFFFLKDKKLALQLMFESKKNGWYLITNDSWDENKNIPIFLNAMKQTIVYNFYNILLHTYKNSKKIQKFIKCQKLNMESFNFSNQYEIHSLYVLFRDLCITNMNTNNVAYFFTYIKDSNKRCNKKDKEYYDALINIMTVRLETAIDKFNKDILMVRYFN